MKDISHLSKHLSYCLLAQAATMNPQKRRRTTTSPAAQASHGDNKTTRHGENFSAGTPTPSSASATLSNDSTATPRNPVRQNAGPIRALAGFKRIAPEQDTGMDLNEPWITALDLFNAGKRS
jgi:hypothetical protein